MDFNTIISAAGNISCKRADTFKINLAFSYADNGDPYSLTTFNAIKMNVKESAKAPNFVLQFTLGSGLTVATNVLTLEKTATEMKINSGTYVYDIEGTTAGGEVITIAAGGFEIKEDVTRDTDTA